MIADESIIGSGVEKPRGISKEAIVRSTKVSHTNVGTDKGVLRSSGVGISGIGADKSIESSGRVAAAGVGADKGVF